MKTKFLNTLPVIAAIAIIFNLFSCSKQSATPAPVQQINSSTVDAVKVTPGTYSVLKFIDTGEDHTSEFDGYSFVFKADGTLVAKTGNGATYKGTWRLNSAQTRMSINISGTKALKDLNDDNWQVVTITSQKISLKKPGPDKVVFVM